MPIAAARRLAREVLVRRARDVTAESATRSCLVVAPHPDDETLGCGATIAQRRRHGAAVTVVVVSDGSRSHTAPDITPADLAAIRRDELMLAVERLGEGIDVLFLDFEDGALGNHVEAIAARLSEIIDRVRPLDVLATSCDEPPADHAAVGRATRLAVARAQVPCRLLEYPVWLWSRWPLPPAATAPTRADLLTSAWRAVFHTSVVRVSTGDTLGAKKHALDAHVTQTTHFRGDPTWTPLPAAMRSDLCGAQELFFVIGDPGSLGRPVI